ncbi:hypothetical protein S83_070527, partial [Arachis hypogaea]
VSPVEEDCIDSTWRKFKDCLCKIRYLGVLDDTYIEVTVLESDKLRYQTRKDKICTNVLGVCNQDMNFVYVLSGWEILRDAITHGNSLKIPH